jgi:hypothetical protein
MPDPETQEMRIEQVEKVADERARAERSEDDAATTTHERRAERAAYLKRKLDDRAKSEDERPR